VAEAGYAIQQAKAAGVGAPLIASAVKMLAKRKVPERSLNAA